MDDNERAVAKYLEDQEVVDKTFSHAVAKKFDAIGTTPNRLTMWRVILSFPMCLCFVLAGAYADIFSFWLFWHGSGAVVYIWAALIDFFDGALSRYQDDMDEVPTTERPRYSKHSERAMTFWEKLNLRGSTHFGAILDPFSDKNLYFGALFPLGWDTVHKSLLFGSLGVALLLTLIRFRAIRRALNLEGARSANRIGKYKIWIEVAAIAILGLLPNGVIKFYAANITVLLALFIGILSLAGHGWLARLQARQTRT